MTQGLEAHEFLRPHPDAGIARAPSSISRTDGQADDGFQVPVSAAIGEWNLVSGIFLIAGVVDIVLEWNQSYCV